MEMKHYSKRLRQYHAAPFAVGAHQTSSMLFVARHARAAVTDSVSRSHDNVMWMAILRPVMPLQVQSCARSLQRTCEGSRKGDISHTSKQDCKIACQLTYVGADTALHAGHKSAQCGQSARIGAPFMQPRGGASTRATGYQSCSESAARKVYLCAVSARNMVRVQDSMTMIPTLWRSDKIANILCNSGSVRACCARSLLHYSERCTCCNISLRFHWQSQS